MTSLLDDDFGLDTGRPKPKRKSQPRGELGPLHALLTRGLPDFIDESGILDSRKLSKAVGISYQAIYKWYENRQVSRKRLNTILHMSRNTVNVPPDDPVTGAKWSPLSREDFWEFLSR